MGRRGQGPGRRRPGKIVRLFRYLQNATKPVDCFDCERKTANGFSPRPGLCRACCVGEHPEDEDCDLCPFIAAGEAGNFALKVFRLACAKHTDPKDKTSRWYLDTDRMLFAYTTYNIEGQDRERIFSRIQLALQILNGEDEIIILDDEDDV